MVLLRKPMTARTNQQCPPTFATTSCRGECERMGVGERILMADEAGRSFYVPPL